MGLFMIRISALGAALAALLFTAAPALAHPKLLSATPADGASATATRKIELRFSETLLPAFSGADVVMTGMPGMAGHSPMKMTGLRVTVTKDGKTMVIESKKPFPAGDYRVDWHVVSSDTHRITGSLSFKAQ